MQERFRVSVRRSCRLALLRPSVWYAKSQARDQSALRQRIREIAMNRPRFGYLRVHVMLRREGWAINKKRVWRLYRLDACRRKYANTPCRAGLLSVLRYQCIRGMRRSFRRAR